jgi:RNase H-fold protein (predicted Holliday junction resolvase)
MFNNLRKYFLRLKITRFIKLAVEAIHSEQFDMELLVTKLESNNKSVDLLIAYVAIEIATRLTEPISKNDIDSALDKTQSSVQHLNEPEFEAMLGLHKDLAEIYWLKKTESILEAKLAHKTNEYSYEGIIYSLENAKKGPTTSQEREKYRKHAKKIYEAEHKLEEYLDEKASKEAAEEVFKKLKDEAESEIRENGPRTKEELQEEFDDLANQLRMSLERKRNSGH